MLRIFKKNFVDFQNFQKSNFDGGKFLKILSFINLPWAYVMSHKKFGPDRFSRFDVYLLDTNKQTDKQTDKPNLYIEVTQAARPVVRLGGGHRGTYIPPLFFLLISFT